MKRALMPFKTGTSLKGKNLLPGREQILSLRAVPYAIEKTIPTSGDFL